MGEIKRYYRLKLKDDFFDSRQMKKLRRVAGGDTYTIIYLKMQLLSINNNGIIEFEGTETDIVEQLALELDEQEDDIRLTLAFLTTNGLAEMNEASDISLVEVPDAIGSETASASRVRRHRRNQKVLQSNGVALQCNTDVTKCNTDIDKDKEIDKEIDIEKKNNNNKKSSTCKSNKMTLDDKLIIYYYYDFIKNNTSKSDLNMICDALSEYGAKKVLYVLYYLKEEQKANISSFKYVESTLKNFKPQDQSMVDYITAREFKSLKIKYADRLSDPDFEEFIQAGGEI